MSPAVNLSLFVVEAVIYLFLALALVVFALVLAVAGALDMLARLRFRSLFRCLRGNGLRATWRLYRARRVASRPGRPARLRVYTRDFKKWTV